MHVDLNPASILSTRWLLACLTNARPYSVGRVLDVGCGHRPYERFFEHTSYIGVDRERLGRSGAHVAADGGALPFAANSFDTVVCTEVIEHVADPWRLMEEVARVLVSGGHLILSAPFVHPLHEEPYDFFRFTHFGVQYLLKGAGFELVARWERGGALSVLISLWSRFLLGLVRTVERRAPSRFRSRVSSGATSVLVERPQRIAARLLIDRRGRAIARLDAPVSLTLGSVIVARRTSTAYVTS